MGDYIPCAIYTECSISCDVYADGFIPSVKGIYEHAQLSVDICLVVERDPASGRRCFSERRPRFGVGAEAKNYTTRARERERTPPSRCRLGSATLEFHAYGNCPKILQNSKYLSDSNLAAPDNRHSVARAVLRSRGSRLRPVAALERKRGRKHVRALCPSFRLFRLDDAGRLPVSRHQTGVRMTAHHHTRNSAQRCNGWFRPASDRTHTRSGTLPPSSCNCCQWFSTDCGEGRTSVSPGIASPRINRAIRPGPFSRLTT